MAAKIVPITDQSDLVICDVVVFGHSFVSRLRNWLVSKNNFNLSLDKSLWRVILHGVGGLTLARVPFEMDIVENLEPNVIVLDIGANDLDSHFNPDPHQVAFDVAQFAMSLRHRAADRVVYLIMAYPRAKPRRSNYNEVLEIYNDALRQQCDGKALVIFPLKNMSSYEQCIGQDGIHLNNNGMMRYYRNIRKACLVSRQHLN